MNRQIHCLLIILCLVKSLPIFAESQGTSTAVPNDMELVMQDQFTQFYGKPNANFSQYNKLLLQLGEIEIQYNWKMERSRNRFGNRFKEDDSYHIQNDIQTVFNDILNEELGKLSSFIITTNADNKTLLVKASVKNLDVYASELDRAYRSQNYIERAGKGELYLDFFDSASGEILFQLIDDKQERYYDTYQPVETGSHRLSKNTVEVISERADAKVIFQEWIESVCGVVDELNR